MLYELYPACRLTLNFPSPSTKHLVGSELRRYASTHGLPRTNKDDKVIGINNTNFAEFMAYEYGLCRIDNVTKFLPLRANDPMCNGLYVSGDGYLRSIAESYVPNLRASEYTNAIASCEAFLDSHPELCRYTNNLDTFIVKDYDGSDLILTVDPMAHANECAYKVGKTVSPLERRDGDIRLNIIYDPNITTCDIIDKWFLGDDYNGGMAKGSGWLAIRMVQAALASHLCPSANIKGWSILYGDGSDGKGTILRVARSIFGDALLYIPTTKLKDNNLGFLEGHIGYVDPELSASTLSEDFVSFLKAVSGEDSVSVGAKYARRAIAVPSISQTTATNIMPQLPQIEDIHETMERRAHVTYFPQKYYRNPKDGQLKVDPTFSATLTQDSEAMSYLFNLMLISLDELIHTGRYRSHEGCDSLKKEWLGLGNSVTDWLDSLGGKDAVYGLTHPEHALLARCIGGSKQRLVVFPAFWSEEQCRQVIKALNDRGTAYNQRITILDEVSHTELTSIPADVTIAGYCYSNEIQALLSRYTAWHASLGIGSNGKLGSSKFSTVLRRALSDDDGNDAISYQTRINLTTSTRARVVAPAGCDGAIAYKEFIKSITPSGLTVSHDAGDYAPYPRIYGYANQMSTDLAAQYGQQVFTPELLHGTATDIDAIVAACPPDVVVQLASIGIRLLANQIVENRTPVMPTVASVVKE